MCRLLEKSDAKSIIAYKVVVKINNEYFSPATGIKYEKNNKQIPVVTEKKSLVSFYVNFLDKMHPSYNPEMIGRTAAFITKQNALDEARIMSPFLTDKNKSSICVLKVRLSDNLMTGYYAGEKAVAGRQMEIIEEV